MASQEASVSKVHENPAQNDSSDPNVKSNFMVYINNIKEEKSLEAVGQELSVSSDRERNASITETEQNIHTSSSEDNEDTKPVVAPTTDDKINTNNEPHSQAPIEKNVRVVCQEEITIKTENEHKENNEREADCEMEYEPIAVKVEINEIFESESRGIDCCNSIENPTHAENTEEILPTNDYNRLPESYYNNSGSFGQIQQAYPLENSVSSLRPDTHNYLEATQSTSYTQPKPSYKCLKCPAIYNTSSGYQNHSKMHLIKEKQQLMYRKRQATMKRIQDIRGFTQYKCEICDKSYVYETSLETHIKRSHKSATNTNSTIKDEPQDYPCLCGKTFSRRSRMDACLKSHASRSQDVENSIMVPPIETLLTNDVQSLPQSKKPSLLQLQFNHKKPRYDCFKCTRSFSNSKSYYRHKKQHLYLEKRQFFHLKRQSNIKKRGFSHFTCGLCDKKYIYELSLHTHMRRYHGPFGIEMGEKEAQTYLCTCGKVFNWKSHMDACHATHKTESEVGEQFVIGGKPISTNEPEAILSTNDDILFVPDSQQFPINNIKSEKNTNEQIEAVKVLPKTVFTTSSTETQEIYKCHKCPMTTITRGVYSQHMKRHLKQEKVSLAQEKRKMTMNHIRDGRSSPSIKCEYCNKRYTYETSLETHINKYHIAERKDVVNEPLEEYPCPCGKTFSRRSRMETCFKSHNVILQKDMCRKCSRCGLYFENKKELKRHKELAHINERYLCKLCPMEYLNTMELFNHLEVHQKVQHMEYKVVAENIEGNQNLKCFICNEASSDLTELKFHVLNDHNAPFSCTICNETFSEIISFMSHTRLFHVRSQEQTVLELLEAFYMLTQTWRCDPCLFQCENPDEMADHLFQHKRKYSINFDKKDEDEARKWKYQCYVCRRLFETYNRLKTHTGIYHVLETEKIKPRTAKKKKQSVGNKIQGNLKYACYICKKKFVSENQFRLHKSSRNHIDINSFFLNEQFFQPTVTKPKLVKPKLSKPKFPGPNFPEPTFAAPKFVEPKFLKQEFNEPEFIEPKFVEVMIEEEIFGK